MKNLNENTKPDIIATPDYLEALKEQLKILIKEFEIGEVFGWKDVLKKTPEGVIKIIGETNVAGEIIKKELKIKNWEVLQHGLDALVDEGLLERINEKLGTYKRIK